MTIATAQGAEQDQERLHEGLSDLNAAAKVSNLTPRPGAQAALAESCQDLAQARETLRLAILAQLREQSETSTAKLSQHDLLKLANGHYAYIRTHTKAALLSVKPQEANTISPKEIERRKRLFNAVFTVKPSDLIKDPRSKQVTTLGQVVAAIEADASLRALNLHQDLAVLLPQLSTDDTNTSDETADDSNASDALKAARSQFDRFARAHKKLVDSALTRQGRQSELGRFIKSADPAYIARRRAQQPVAQDPDAANLSDPTPAPAPHL